MSAHCRYRGHSACHLPTVAVGVEAQECVFRPVLAMADWMLVVSWTFLSSLFFEIKHSLKFEHSVSCVLNKVG